MDVVAWVNNEAISKSELKHWMLLEKANVYNYFYQTYKETENDNFWTQQLGDEIPLNKLRDEALLKAKRSKVQLMLARDKDIIATADFDEIMQKLDSVNADRQEKHERGEPIYGPVKFTSRTYFFDHFDKTVIELKNALAKNELKPNELQLQELQQTNGNLEFLIMQLVDENYEEFIDQLTDKASIKIIHKVYDETCLN